MTKIRICVSVDYDIIERYKKHGISISPFLNCYLHNYADLHFNGKLEKPELANVKKMVADNFIELEERKPDLRDSEKEYISRMIKRHKYDAGNKTLKQKLETRWEFGEGGAFKEAFSKKEYFDMYEEVANG